MVTVKEQPGEVYSDPVIEAYKKDVDRTLIRECLRRTPEERLFALVSWVAGLAEMRSAMKAATRR